MELDENPERWITLAVLEGEKDSPAKRLLTKKLQKVSELYLPHPTARRPRTAHKVRRIRPHNAINRQLGNAKRHPKKVS